MHSFSSSHAVFPSLFERSVDICRNIDDELVLFDREGRIRATRMGDPVLRREEDFFSLLEEGERLFFEENCLDRAHDRLALMTRYGAAVVFCGLFPTCGLFVAVISPEEAWVLRAACEGTPESGLALSDTVRRSFGERPDPERVIRLARTLGGAVNALCFYKEKRGSLGDAAQLLIDRACEVASLVGCHLGCREELHGGISDAFVFSMPAYVSLLLLLLIRARLESLERRAQLLLFVRDGRIFLELSAECGGAETETLDFCREVAEKKELPFEVGREGTREAVALSPTVCDVSYLGLKNPFLYE